MIPIPITRRRALILGGIVGLILLAILLSHESGTSFKKVDILLPKFGLDFRRLQQSAVYPFTEENCKPREEPELHPIDDQEYCPNVISDQLGVSVSRRPTVILTPIGGGLEPWDSPNRTTFMPQRPETSNDEEFLGTSEPFLSDIGFLGWGPSEKDEQSYPNGPRRFREGLRPRERCPVYEVPASDPYPLDLSPSKTYLPSIGATPRGCRPINNQNQGLMFGFATTPSRVLDFLPRWCDWLNSSQSARVERVLVLIPPEADATASDKIWEIEMISKALGLPLKMKPVAAKRYELRYMKLVKQMWLEATEREASGQTRTDWFIIADDDTYFLSLEAANRMLSKYNPREAHLVGSLSESQTANRHFGHIAYGGAGIFISRGLMEKLNAAGAFENCFRRYSQEYGGDGMIFKCVASLSSNTTFKPEPSLHQLDLRDEGHGIFQAGLQFTSIHHWRSWLQLQPRSHPYTLKDPLALVALLGQAARTVGAENWSRRYVWGFGDGTRPDLLARSGAVVVSLGYSVTIFANSVLQRSHLDEVEGTFAHEPLVIKLRPALLETAQRRTYYLRSIRVVERTEGLVAVMTHINQEGQTMDLVWDARRRPQKEPSVAQ